VTTQIAVNKYYYSKPETLTTNFEKININKKQKHLIPEVAKR